MSERKGKQKNELLYVFNIAKEIIVEAKQKKQCHLYFTLTELFILTLTHPKTKMVIKTEIIVKENKKTKQRICYMDT